jgi:transposase-like protein
MQRHDPPYSPAFRAEAVRLLGTSGKSVAELSRELGVAEQTLRRWRRQAADDGRVGVGMSIDERSRPQELARERLPAVRGAGDPATGGREASPSRTLDPPSTFDESLRAATGRRLAFNAQGEDRFVRRLLMLTAEVIDVGVAVVTLPAQWAASGLRWYAHRMDEPPGKASVQDGEGPVAAE